MIHYHMYVANTELIGHIYGIIMDVPEVVNIGNWF